MKTLATFVALNAAALALAVFLGAGCYSLTPQDRSALQTAEALGAASYCRLGREADAGPNVAAARALQRGEHAEVAGVLRRNGGEVDAGADGGVPCP